MVTNERVCEVTSKSLLLDSKRESCEYNLGSSNRINRYEHKNEIGSHSSICSENYNANSLTNSENNNLELNSRMSRTELYSHANVVVVGINFIIIREKVRCAEVALLMPGYDILNKLPIAHASTKSYDKYSEEKCLLFFYGATWVPSMAHNLVPPFILNEAGIESNIMRKKYIKSSSKEDHSKFFKEVDMRIHLLMNGMLSCFPSCKPSDSMLNDNDIKVIAMTP